MATLELATVGGKIKASMLNAIIGVLTPATNFSPAIANFTSAGSAEVIVARYWRTGNVVKVHITGTLGGSPVTVGDLTLTVPIPIDITGMSLNNDLLNGTVGLFDVGTGQFTGVVRVVDANTVRIMRSTTTSLSPVSNTTPFTWTAGDKISISFDYPVVP